MAPESRVEVAAPPSLLPLRIVAVLGVLVALAGVVWAFATSIVLGVFALILAPVVPLALVLAADRIRGTR